MESAIRVGCLRGLLLVTARSLGFGLAATWPNNSWLNAASALPQLNCAGFAEGSNS